METIRDLSHASIVWGADKNLSNAEPSAAGAFVTAGPCGTVVTECFWGVVSTLFLCDICLLESKGITIENK